jgi:transcriptional regulator with XRE-family HTH domain
MLKLRLDGMTYDEIARKAGVSRQRIQQLLSPPPDIRDFVVKKFNGLCNHCGIKVGTSGQVHHHGTDEEETYNDIPNLELLCLACHRAEHQKLLGKTRITPEMEERNALVIEYHKEGYSLRAIAKKVNISFVQVGNIIRFSEGKSPNLK